MAEPDEPRHDPRHLADPPPDSADRAAPAVELGGHRPGPDPGLRAGALVTLACSIDACRWRTRLRVVALVLVVVPTALGVRDGGRPAARPPAAAGPGGPPDRGEDAGDPQPAGQLHRPRHERRQGARGRPSSIGGWSRRPWSGSGVPPAVGRRWPESAAGDVLGRVQPARVRRWRLASSPTGCRRPWRGSSRRSPTSPPRRGCSTPVEPGDAKLLRGEDITFTVTVEKGEPDRLQLDLRPTVPAKPLRYDLEKVDARILAVHAERLRARRSITGSTAAGRGPVKKRITMVDRPRARRRPDGPALPRVHGTARAPVKARRRWPT